MLGEIAALQKKVAEIERRSLVADAALPPHPVADLAAAPAVRHTDALPRPAPVVPASDTRAPVELDVAIDGTRRRQRVVVLFALAMVVVFGGLLGTLALSYV